MGKINIVNMGCVLACLFVLFVESHAKLAPALYVFGDSFLDNGNNNNIARSMAKVDYPPYGIDFPTGHTGRFTNGKTIADFFSDSLGLPLSPPFMTFDTKKVHKTGFTYASASSGLLDDSGVMKSGWNLNMRKQVKLFRRTVRKYLPKLLKSERKMKKHLAKSIYLLNSGSNDYGLNFMNPLSNNSKIYTPVTFAVYLVSTLETHLRELHRLGAMKFVVLEIGALGCFPGATAAMVPKIKCIEPVNMAVNIYNDMVKAKLTELAFTLEGSTFVIGKMFDLIHDLVLNPTNYGLTTSTECCPNWCKPNEIPCNDRDKHVFWDQVHPSQATYKIAATKCFNETGFCVPMSLRELARMR